MDEEFPGRYSSRSRPWFAGDDWHELRDAQNDESNETVSRIAGLVADFYRRAAIVMGDREDSILDSLQVTRLFDVRTLGVAHAHLAAYWRFTNGHVNPTLPHIVTFDHMVRDWQEWVWGMSALWIIDNPLLVRLFCLVLVQQNTADGIVAEMDLWDELRRFYALPGTETRDMFLGDPNS
ncbi:MAG: hypothetical protein Q8Q26_05140 [Pseudorhodobacter sp.]|nr:hypothetical protein [Pseudorhodobacter sp.]